MSASEGGFQCPCCQQTFGRLSKLMKHMKAQHTVEEVLVALNVSEQQDKSARTE